MNFIQTAKQICQISVFFKEVTENKIHTLLATNLIIVLSLASMLSQHMTIQLPLTSHSLAAYLTVIQVQSHMYSLDVYP